MPRRLAPPKREAPGAAPWGAGPCPGGAGAVDDSLTNLQWLQGFSFLPASPEKPACASLLAPASPPAGDTAAMGAPAGTGQPASSSASSSGPEAAVDYRTNGHVKPPYSYATLISMAMRASPDAKVTLSAIYAWITDHFCYYRHAEPSWQNSIRHNLSLNKCFQKVARQKDEPGKGGFWRINPQHADRFVDGIFQRRRVPAFPCGASAARAIPALPAAGAELGCFPGRGPAPLKEGQRPLGECKEPPGQQQQQQGSGRAAWIAAHSPPGSAGTEGAPLPGELSWASVLEDTFVGGGGGSSLDDLELTAALSSLAAEEEVLTSDDQPAGALSQAGAPRPGTDLVEDLTLYGADPLGQPWGEEEAAAQPQLGPPWAFEGEEEEEGGFLAEMQPWEA